MIKFRKKAVAHYDTLMARGVDHKRAIIEAARFAGVSIRTIYYWRRLYGATALQRLQ